MRVFKIIKIYEGDKSNRKGFLKTDLGNVIIISLKMPSIN
jgi:hypothetical protein